MDGTFGAGSDLPKVPSCEKLGPRHRLIHVLATARQLSPHPITIPKYVGGAARDTAHK